MTMDGTLRQILAELFAAHQEIDRLRAYVGELEQQINANAKEAKSCPTSP